MNKVKTISIVLAGLALGCGIALLLRPKDPPLHGDLPIPKEGLVVNPEGKNPGNPENAVADFKRIYAAMASFRNRNGRLPELAELLNFNQPLNAGLGLTKDDFNVPDAIYSDHYGDGQKNLSTYMFAYRAKRPDGSPKPAFPKPGERDVWLVSMDYVRTNQVVYQDHHSDTNLTGVYVVLWSDGKIEKVPAGGEQYAKRGNDRVTAFEGQTGLPKDTKTYSDLHRDDTFNNRKINGKKIAKS